MLVFGSVYPTNKKKPAEMCGAKKNEKGLGRSWFLPARRRSSGVHFRTAWRHCPAKFGCSPELLCTSPNG